MSLAKKAQNWDEQLEYDSSWEDNPPGGGDLMLDVGEADDDEEEEDEEDEEEDSEEEDEDSKEGEIVLEISDDPESFVFELPMLPGSLDQEMLEELTVEEEPEDEIVVEEKDMWDWGGKPANFMPWMQKMFGSIPPYYGHEILGVERAIAFLEGLLTHARKAVRMDMRNELDISLIEDIKDKIEAALERLKKRRDTLEKNKGKQKKAADYQEEGMIKEAQKIAGVKGIMITVPLLISRIARVCINGMVSGGHDIEDLFARQIKEYNLDKREQAETMQLLEDMGYTIRRDRGFLRDQEIDVTKENMYDWQQQFYG